MNASGSRWAVDITVRTLVRVSTTGWTIGIANVSVRWTFALSATESVSAQGRSMAGVAFATEVNKHTADNRITFIAFPTGTCSGMMLRDTVCIWPTTLANHAEVDTFVLVTNLIIATIFVVETFSLFAPNPTVERVSNVALEAFADGAVLVRDADRIPSAQGGLARINTSVITTMRRAANSLLTAFAIVEAAVSRFAVAEHATKAFGTIAVCAAHFTATAVLADLIAATLTVRFTVKSA